MPTLQDLRQAIDALDAELLSLLEKRFDLARQTRTLKKEITDPKREREMHARWEALSRAKKLSVPFASALLDLILAESRRSQHMP